MVACLAVTLSRPCPRDISPLKCVHRPICSAHTTSTAKFHAAVSDIVLFYVAERWHINKRSVQRSVIPAVLNAADLACYFIKRRGFVRPPKLMHTLVGNARSDGMRRIRLMELER